MNREFYMLVRTGLVQRLETTINGTTTKVWPLADNHEDAALLAKWFDDPNVRPAIIGSVHGESLQGHITLALLEGCTAMCCVAGWESDGTPKWKWILFDD